MSAPDPEKWKLTQDELDVIDSGVDMYGVESEEVQSPVYAVARRRALAELIAIRSAYPHQLQALHDRIAAIEAEEA